MPPPRSIKFDNATLAELRASTGDYYLLAIAVDRYDLAPAAQKFRKLNNAVLDAASVVEVSSGDNDWHQQ